MLKLTTLNESELTKLAAALAEVLRPSDCLALYGDLGAGKTTFCRAFIRSLVPNIGQVPSPTFNIVQQYDTPNGELWHCDLYRLEHPDEIIELGLEEAFSYAITMLEWPEKILPYLPRQRLEITITINQDQTRHVTLSNLGLTHVNLETIKFRH